MQLILGFFLVVFVVSGCGDDGGPLGVCQWGLAGVCVEQDGDEAAARFLCTQLNGTFEEGKVCPSVDRLGGCQYSVTNDQGTVEEIVWFYPDAERDTEAEIREFCTTNSGEYLPPE